MYTLQEHQWILTNATVSKDSDFAFIMVVYENFFKTIFKYLREMKKYVSKLILHKKNYKIGLSKLCWNFSTIYKDGSDIYRFLKVQVMFAIMLFYNGENPTKSVIDIITFGFKNPLRLSEATFTGQEN